MLTTPGVRSMPTLPLRALVGGGKGQLPHPLNRQGVTHWFSGRVALFQAIGALGLRSGDAVALPAFCCGSELEPFIHAGLKPRFFRLTDNLDPDPMSFEAALKGAAVALAIHYFGFAADLAATRQACRTARVPLIEDCAHALYSRDANDWLGSNADVAVFSVTKTLPVPDGGALLTTMRTEAVPSAGTSPARQVIAKRTRSLLIRHLQTHPVRAVSWAAHLPRAAKNRFGLTSPEPNRETQAGLAEYGRFDASTGNTQMSARSMRLLAHTSHDHVRGVRRQNYERLLQAVKGVPGVRPLFSSLPDGTCPLVLPVAAANPDAFRRRLAADPGVGVRQMWPWFHPAVNWDDFPFEASLKRTVFILPVHQSLREQEVDRIITVMEKWTRT